MFIDPNSVSVLSIAAASSGVAEVLDDTGRVPTQYKNLVILAMSLACSVVFMDVPSNLSGASEAVAFLQNIVGTGIVSGLVALGAYHVASGVKQVLPPKV